MRIKQFGLVFFALIGVYVLSVTCQEYKLIKIPSTDGKCLDGSQPAIYYRQAHGYKWIIYFESGGWCGSSNITQTLADCYSRSLTPLGSSNAYSDTYVFQGIMSSQFEISKYYYEYNAVWIKYCDGTGHQGYNSDPYIYNGNQVWFRGENNTREALNYMLNNLNMTLAQEVVVTGGSAGGLAVYTWIDTIASFFDLSKTKVIGLADAGIFLDDIDISSHDHSYLKLIQNFMTFSNNQTDPLPATCAQYYPNQKWKCMMAETLIPFVNTPTFITESQYDFWSIQNILGISCAAHLNLSTCNSVEMYLINNYRNRILSILNNTLTTKTTWGVWTISCVMHGFAEFITSTNLTYTIPQGSMNTLQETFQQWQLQQQNNFTDDEVWPQNYPCSYT